MNGYTQRSAARTGHENGQDFENSKPTGSGSFMKQSHTRVTRTENGRVEGKGQRLNRAMQKGQRGTND